VILCRRIGRGLRLRRRGSRTKGVVFELRVLSRELRVGFVVEAVEQAVEEWVERGGQQWG